jgi:hypothetical protein
MGHSGLDLLTLSFSHFDPLRSLRNVMDTPVLTRLGRSDVGLRRQPGTSRKGSPDTDPIAPGHFSTASTLGVHFDRGREVRY